MAFELILHAGNAKSLAMEAIYASRENDFVKAEQKHREAIEELKVAHQHQTKMLFVEATGINTPVDMLLCHAMDHLTMATITCEVAEEAILLRKEK